MPTPLRNAMLDIEPPKPDVDAIQTIFAEAAMRARIARAETASARARAERICERSRDVLQASVARRALRALRAAARRSAA